MVLSGLWAVAIAWPVFRYLKRPTDNTGLGEVVIAEKEELQPGDSKPFQFGETPGILVRQKNGAYAAYNATCTHLGCIVQVRKAEQDIYCACHGGVYDMHGKNVSGPPPKPLETLKISVNPEGKVLVSKA